MQRDYTSAREEQLVKLSSSCEEQGFFNKVVDFCEDMVIRFTIATDLLKADDAVFDFNGDVLCYQCAVIDAENMKADEIRKIFSECRSSDGAYGSDFGDAAEALGTITSGLQELTNSINPTMNALTSQSMKSMGKKIDEEMTAVRKSTDERLNRELGKLEKYIAKKSAWDLVGDVVGCISDLGSFMYSCAKLPFTGRWDDVLFDGYGFVNNFMASLHDGGALLACGMSWAFGAASGGGFTVGRLDVLGQAAEMQKTDNLSQIFNQLGDDMYGESGIEKGLSGFFHFLGGACETAETGKEIHDMVNTATDILDPDADKEFLPDERIKEIDKEIEKKQGLKTEWYKKKKIAELEEQKAPLERIQNVKKAGDKAKTVKKGTDIYKRVSGEDRTYSPLKETKPGKIVSKGAKLYNDAKERVEEWVEENTTKKMPAPFDSDAIVMY